MMIVCPFASHVSLRSTISGLKCLNDVSESKDEIGPAKDVEGHFEARIDGFQKDKQKSESQRDEREEDRSKK